MTVTLECCGAGIIVPVRVKAGAKRTGVAGVHDGALRIHVSVAPEKGNANRAVARVLSEVFDVARASVKLSAGVTNSQKRFLIEGIGVETARTRVTAALAEL